MCPLLLKCLVNGLKKENLTVKFRATGLFLLDSQEVLKCLRTEDADQSVSERFGKSFIKLLKEHFGESKVSAKRRCGPKVGKPLKGFYLKNYPSDISFHEECEEEGDVCLISKNDCPPGNEEISWEGCVFL